MRLSRSFLLSAVLSAVLLCSCDKDVLSPVEPESDPDPVPMPVVPGKPEPPAIVRWGLKDLARANGLLIGAAFTYLEYTKDDSLRVVLQRDFDAVTFGNEMKHDNIVTKTGELYFGRADQMVGWANDCGLRLFGHTLGWHSQQQCDYLNPLINGAENAEQAASLVREAHKTWVEAMVKHFDVYGWDVVNEAFTESGGWRSGSNTQAGYHIFLWGDYYKGGTKEFVDTAFKTAKAALERNGKNAILYINDYNLEWSPAKLEAICKYAESNPDVTGIGSQMHCNTDLSEENIRNMLSRMVKTGKMVRISELDVPQGTIPTNTQADLIVTIFKLYLDRVPEEQRGGISFWGVSDKNSWLGADKTPLLYDALYLPKEAYLKLHAYLLERSGLDKK